MKSFVGVVVLVLGLTLFAASNTMTIPFRAGSFSAEVPLSLALIFPVGVALLSFALFHLRKMNKVDLVIRNLEDALEEAQKQLVAMTKRVHELEIENKKMKIRVGEPEDIDDNSL